jgi:fructose-1,6-bisphosphatase II
MMKNDMNTVLQDLDKQMAREDEPEVKEAHYPSRNIGLDLLRVTEATALAAGRWIGSGNYQEAHNAATEAMCAVLNEIDIDGRIVIGEEGRVGSDSVLASGNTVGTGDGPPMDVVVDPIDGTSLLVQGSPGAISVIGVAPRDSFLSIHPAIYMDKIIVDRQAAEALVPEAMNAPAAWTLALIARVKKKAVRDLDVIVLYKRRHQELIEEIRSTGARVWLRPAADVEGALVAATTSTNADVLMGIGGAAEGITAACAVKALGGAMLARLAPQSSEERETVLAAGHDLNRIWTVDELVAGNKVFFAATGITRSWLLEEVRYVGDVGLMHSILLRAETGTRRYVHTRQLLQEE